MIYEQLAVQAPANIGFPAASISCDYINDLHITMHD